MDHLIKYLPLALFLLNALTVWACWSLRQLAKSEIAEAVAALRAKDEAICEDVDEHDTKITRLEGQVERIERDIENLPTKADIARLEGDVKEVGSAVRAVQSGVGRLEGYFLTRGVENVG
ncbi:DUF2730 family protein [Phenylobacterium sp.]|uniref:DUF2730 family protein n=1 Tax=Phenylobacterium sp. TaxID=1871053 RepID=UPI00272F9C7A|nr:DUF2730 family protein [Phenylobacterium sp.]MDP1617328.1 DUF2730 family protein [Phenylobacterium sp.]MDP1985700.1 DUF2730 family protein [Phenylobacterium sp.]